MNECQSAVTLQSIWSAKRKNLGLPEISSNANDQDDDVDRIPTDKYIDNSNPNTKFILLFHERSFEREELSKKFSKMNFNVKSVGDQAAAMSLYDKMINNTDVIVIGLKGPGYRTLDFLEAKFPIRIPVILVCDNFVASNVDSSLMSEDLKRATSNALRRAEELGVDIQVGIDFNLDRMQGRLRHLMERFHDTGHEYRRIKDLSNPDYSVNSAKKLVLEELDKQKQAQLKRAAMLNNISGKLKKQTVDVDGCLTTGRSKFAMALKRSRAADQAKKRAAKYQAEKQFRRSTLSIKATSNGDEQKNSDRILDFIMTKSKAVSTLANRQVLKKNQKKDSIKGGNFKLAVLTELSLQKNKIDGRLPVLRDYRENLMQLQLPWEKRRQEQVVSEVGKVPELTSEDLLQSKFREIVLTTKSISSGQRYLQKGYDLKRSGDFVGAIAMYSRATLADYGFLAAHLCRGVAFHLIGDDDNAVKDFKQCLKIDSSSIDARFNLALIYVHEGFEMNAIEVLNEAISINGKDEELYTCRAHIHRRCNNFLDAQKDYTKREDLRKETERNLQLTKELRRKRLQRSLSIDSDSDEDSSSISYGLSSTLDENGDGRVDLQEFTAANSICDNVYTEIFQQRTAIEVACAKPSHLRSLADLTLIEHATREIALFRKMPQRLVREMCREVELASVMPGSYVVAQGEESLNFFAILEGVLHVTVELSDADSEHVVNVMKQGEYFGENALIQNLKRGANIVAPKDGDTVLLFVVSKDLFYRTEMNRFCWQDRNECKEILRHCKIFDDMGDEAFYGLTQIARVATYARNTIMLRQGESASRFCILVSGLCKILKYRDTGADLVKKRQKMQQKLNQFETIFAIHHANEQNAKTVIRNLDQLKKHAAIKEEVSRIEQQLESLKEIQVDENPELILEDTIYPGNVFGEEALLDPYYGKETYTVVSDTYVKILFIHKEQLQAYKQSELLIEKVKRKKLISQQNS